MHFDPETEPEKARLIASLLADGDHVEAISSCPDCRGSFTALLKRDLVARAGAACVFCNSPRVSLLVLDPGES